MLHTLLAVLLVLFASRGVAAAHPPDPAPVEEASHRIAILIDESAALSLPPRVERAFLLTLHAAGEAIRQGQVSQALTLLRTFAFEVRGVKRARRLRADTADALIARAEDVIRTLGGP
jgi:hypothetical protein